MAYRRHSRAEWLQFSAFGISGPSQDRSAVRNLIIHYTGGNTTVRTDEEMARLLARINDQYWRDANRGYAIGYNWGCATHNGDLWDIRSHDIRCGANGCQLVNVPYVAILVPTPNIGAQPSAAQDDALKNVWVPQLKSVYPNIQVHVFGHRDVRGRCGDGGGTACPGEPIYSRIRNNFYDTPGVTPPPTPVSTGDDDMATLIASSDGTVEQKNQWFLLVGAQPHVLPTTQTRVDVVALGTVNKTIVSQNQQPFRNLTVSDIQVLLDYNWAGPRGNFATVGGYRIPADTMSVTAVSEARASKDHAAAVRVSVGPDLKAAVAAIPTTGGGGTGGGISLDQLEDTLGRSTVQVDSVPGNAPIVVNEA